MLNTDMQDKLQQTIKAIEINFERLDYALLQLQPVLPFTTDNYYLLEPQTISYIDQYIFRFAKCQDLIGDKLFRLLLISSEENIENDSFINILNKLEKFGIFEDKTEWIVLRKLRNSVSHEYPVLDDEATLSLNQLFHSKEILKNIYDKCIVYLQSLSII